MAAGHKHRRLVLFGSVAPDGHLLRKSIFFGEEIASQCKVAIHHFLCPVQQKPSGLQGQQLCRVVRAGDFRALCAPWGLQFPARAVFTPVFPAILQQGKIQHQCFVQVVPQRLNIAKTPQPANTYRWQILFFRLQRRIIKAVHGQQPPGGLRVAQPLLALPCIQRKESEFIFALYHFAVEHRRAAGCPDFSPRHLPEGMCRVEQPEAVLPLFQIVPQRLLREMPQLPQVSPASQSIILFFKRFWLTFHIHAGKHGKQHRQQQPQHGGILRGHFACQIHIILRMEQCVRQ